MTYLCYYSSGEREVFILIVYDKMLALLKDKGYTSYRIKKENIIGQATLTKIKQGKGGLDHRSIDNLCRVLHCQPSDLMEYVEDPIDE